jgi:dienelactone hydrolase
VKASDGGADRYGENGTHSVSTATFNLTSPTDSFSTTAYIPSGAGPFPVVVLSSGFEQPGAAYAPYANRLASWGVVTLLRDDPGVLSSLTSSNLADDVAYVISTWLPATNTDPSSALDGKVDAAKVGLAGHSRGGQVALLAAANGAKGKIEGVFGLDPVDTASGDVEARTSIATVGVAIAFIGETTDGTGGVAGMPCAPLADNYQVLYAAASSPAVAITAIGADHTMFEDPSQCSFCTLCTAGTASPSAVLDASVRYLTAFFARQLLGDAAVGAAFQGAGIGADVASGLVSVVSK